ncbi:uncharacterized protein LOC142348008 [Convolutriloba macropyga]|uniref:uncharacterized protein LOC142348008 n=1 Tax=Convolutriloba macropyga TaxID=536237 RepID=UPI003F5245FB
MCDSGSSISFVDKSVVSKLHLQGRKASLSVAGIHGSQDVRHVKGVENPADIGTRGMSLNIAKLSPFIEEDGTIRVKGRLKHSNLDYNAKHPILIGENCSSTAFKVLILANDDWGVKT